MKRQLRKAWLSLRYRICRVNAYLAYMRGDRITWAQLEVSAWDYWHQWRHA